MAPANHRKLAEELLAKAQRLAFTDPARMAFLAEAQVHALLAQPVDEVGTPAVPEIDAQLAAPKAARRTRKAAPAKEATE